MKDSALYNLKRTYKHHGCWVCEHNPEGVCELAKRDVPMAYALMNGHPKWCPKGKERK